MQPFDIARELSPARLPDKRLNKRLAAVAAAMAAGPTRSFPEAFSDPSQLEGTYRLLNNERVKPDALIAPHIEATAARCREAKQLIVAHDTTYFSFAGTKPIEGLGIVDNKGRAFSGHFAFALDGADERIALGVVGMHTFMRTEFKHSDRDRNKRISAADKEKLRWPEMIECVEERLGPCRPIHVMDREGDWFELFANLISKNRRFVVRMAYDRCLAVAGPSARIADVMWSECAKGEREVQLGAIVGRGPQNSRKQNREARVAKLEVAAATVQIARPFHTVGELPSLVTINVVHVREPNPPEGVEPVGWMLATTEPIDTKEAMLAVLDIYRARWVIEEFFKALKTGCAYEKRQLGSADALLNALALFVPMAWALLRLRNAGRTDATSQTLGEVLTETQLKVLCVASRTKLSTRTALKDGALAIARLGGYVNTARPPGWLILARGLERLLTLEAGWLLAKDAM